MCFALLCTFVNIKSVLPIKYMYSGAWLHFTPFEHEGQAIVSIFNRVLSLSRPSEKKKSWTHVLLIRGQLL